MEMLGSFVQTIRVLAESFPEIDIIVRPHPVEDEAAWQGILGDAANVIVSHEGSISGWIRGASALIHNSCTSALEAVVCGTPTLAYRPVVSEREKMVPNSLSVECFDEAQLVASVRELVGGERKVGRVLSDETEALLESRLENVQEEFAFDTTVGIWEQMVTETGEGEARKTMMDYGFPRWARKQGVKKWLGRCRPGQSRMRKTAGGREKCPEIRLSEVENIRIGMNNAIGRFENVRAERISENLFRVSGE
jgi:hypothetical protein